MPPRNCSSLSVGIPSSLKRRPHLRSTAESFDRSRPWEPSFETRGRELFWRGRESSTPLFLSLLSLLLVLLLLVFGLE